MYKSCIVIAYNVPFLQTFPTPSGPTCGCAACQRTALQMKPLVTSRCISWIMFQSTRCAVSQDGSTQMSAATQEVCLVSMPEHMHTCALQLQRFPTWMWRNKTVVAFLDWLHGRNTSLPQEEQRLRSAGFYGLDVYSLNSSMQTVISYLEKVDPEAAKTAKQRYSCFDRYTALTARCLSIQCFKGAVKRTLMRHITSSLHAWGDIYCFPKPADVH